MPSVILLCSKCTSAAAGVELMLLILKQKRLARAGALKAIDFATTKSPGNCERFVDQFGLKTVFAMFMGKAKVRQSGRYLGHTSFS